VRTDSYQTIILKKIFCILLDLRYCFDWATFNTVSTIGAPFNNLQSFFFKIIQTFRTNGRTTKAQSTEVFIDFYGQQLTPLDEENNEIINHSKIQLKLKRDNSANLI